MPALVRLNPAECAVLLVDLQERLVPAVLQGEACVVRAGLLAWGARKVGIPVLATEQYPKGLGKTLPALAEHFSLPAWEKTRFSAALEPVIDWLRRDARRTVVLAGLETHICLTQTALDLIEADFAVAVVVDACSAGGRVDHEAALARLTAAGALPLTTEAALFEWMGDSGHPAFREISARVRQQREAPARPVG